MAEDEDEDEAIRAVEDRLGEAVGVDDDDAALEAPAVVDQDYDDDAKLEVVVLGEQKDLVAVVGGRQVAVDPGDLEVLVDGQQKDRSPAAVDPEVLVVEDACDNSCFSNSEYQKLLDLDNNCRGKEDMVNL